MSFSILNSPPPSPNPNPIPVPLPSPSCVAHCPELDLSVTLSPASKTDRMQQNPRQPKQSQQRAQPQPRPRPRGQAGKKRKTKVHFEEPVAVTVTPEPHIVPHQQPIKGQRRSSGHHHVGRCSVDPPPAAFVQDPCCLENAELNSTLALKVELQSLQETEFNSQKALQETLQKSERTKTLINARATEVVNVSRSQHLFNSLVSVNVQEGELLSQVLQARLMLAPPPSCCYDNKTAEGPTLNVFIPPDLFRQTPIPQEEEPALCKPSPVACTAYSTFDLYRRQRCWEATP